MVAIGMSKFYEFANNQHLVKQLSDHIAKNLLTNIEQSGHALLAVSGGNSPKELFAHLNSQTLAWQKVTIVLVDERCVPPSHEDSNESMVRKYLLKNAASQANFIGWTADTNDLQHIISQANEKFEHLSLPFSCVILGMGNDGHTASWFADAPEFNDLIDPAASPAVCLCHPTSAPHTRVTLNYSAVMQTKSMYLQIKGSEKKSVYDAACNVSSRAALPIHVLLNDASPLEIYWTSK